MAQLRIDPSFFAPPSDANPFRRPLSAVLAPVEGEEATFAMVQVGPAVDPSECERADRSEVEITIRWGSNVLGVAHVPMARGYRIGEEHADFVVPASVLGGINFELVQGGEPATLCVPPGATVRRAGQLVDASTLSLDSGACYDVRLGELSIRVAAVAAGKETARKLVATSEAASMFSFGLTALAAGALMTTLAMFVPPLGLTEDDSASQERIYAIQQYLDSAAERERERKDPTPVEEHAQGGSEAAAAGAKGESGALGKVGAPRTNRRAATAGPKDTTDPHLAREQAMREARSFGMIGLLNDGGGSMAQTAPWGRDTSLGTDDLDAIGNMWGDDLGESGGSGGLALSGIGSGGGLRGDSIGLGSIGTCGSTFCGGLEHGFGSSTARPGGTHKPVAPTMRPGVTDVSGSLPGDVIQRIVRQNYGRFRMCYENGLRGNPNLAGRVAVRFVISRDGAVSHATNAGSDLPDSSVVGCVVSAYYGLSFPAPQDGIVTVNYPIQFSPG
ncbi:MAG: AgmX/PglI C-terminal domain-containing protein [Polyangiaceae bacterium]|nr:AgmX/PglI C-terminal domain-containing protein [Polyangiaceae bacterium]